MAFDATNIVLAVLDIYSWVKVHPATIASANLIMVLSEIWDCMNPALPGFLYYVPLVCRLAALTLAAPFAFCIALDIIAYAIARTLHLSMSQRRVPRSPSVLLDNLSPIIIDDMSAPTTSSTSGANTPLKPQQGYPRSHYRRSRSASPASISPRTSSTQQTFAKTTLMSTDEPSVLALSLESTHDAIYHLPESPPRSNSASTTSLQSVSSVSSATISNSSSSSSISTGPATLFETRFPPGGRRRSTFRLSAVHPEATRRANDQLSPPFISEAKLNPASYPPDVSLAYPSPDPSPETRERSLRQQIPSSGPY